MKQRRTTIIVQPALEKLPVFGRLGIARRFCPAVGFWGTSLPSGRPRRAQNRAFRNPALCAAAIPSSPANPGLCSSRAVAVSWPRHPATSLSWCAISSPANQSNFLGALSPLATVAGQRENTVFTHTQITQRFCIFPLAVGRGNARNS